MSQAHGGVMSVDKKRLAELSRRRAEALESGGSAKLEERARRGVWSARQRIAALFQEGSFQEMGLLAHHSCHEFGLEQRRLPADGVVTGVGMVSGHPVAAFSQDFTVGGGALGRVHAKKLLDLMSYAARVGIPLVGFNDGGGARIQEGVHSMSGYGEVFFQNVLLSGLVPQIAVIAGPCAGGAAYSPALMDFVIMTRSNASMFICGPEVIKAVTGQVTTMEEIGGAQAHAQVSGNVHFIADDEAHAVRLVHALLSYLPPNNLHDPPHQLSDQLSLENDPGMDDLVPESSRDLLDTHEVIRRVVDRGELLEVHRDFAPNIIVGFARIEGVVVGVVANQPKVRAGTLDIDASDKAARFIRVCNVFNVPLVSFVDVPGFLPGVAQERGGIIRHGAKMLFAWASATVPKITVILRKAYGGAYVAMGSKDLGADMVFAWPTAEIAVMGAEGAVNILFREQLARAEDPKALRARLMRDYEERFAAPWQAAEAGLITDVIEPGRTRAAVALALRHTLTKREVRPPKKHGNITM